MAGPDNNIEVVAALRDLISTPAGAATAALRNMEQQLEDLNRDFVAGRITQDEYVRSLRRVSRTSRLAGRDSDRFRRALRDQERAVGRNRRRGLRGVIDGLQNAFGGLMGAFGSLTKMLPKLRLPALGAAFSILIPIITAVGGGVLALVGNFGPMVTLLAGLPGLLLAGGAAIGVLALAFGGLSEGIALLMDDNATLAQQNEFWADKTPAAKMFGTAIANLEAPFKALRDAVQEATLPGFTDMVERLSTVYLPFLQKRLARIGEKFGELAQRFADMATSSAWLKDMDTIWNDVEHTIGEVGNAILHVISALRGVMVAFAPVMRRMADDFEGMTARFDRWANTVEGRDAMGKMFERGRKALYDLWDIISNVGIALWNIANIGRDMGGDMAGGMVEATQRFREWTESADGQNRIKQFFEDIKETLEALGGLFSAIGKELGMIGAGVGEQNAATSFLTGLTNFVPVAGDLIRALIIVAGVLGFVIEKLGAAGPYVLAFGLIFAKFGGFIMFVGRILFWVAKQVIMRILIPAIVALAGIIGWPITIALLLVAAFVLLYKKSEKFRDAVGWLKDKMAGIWDGFLEGVEKAIDFVQDLIDKIKKVDMPNPLGIGDGKDDWGWGRQFGGPVWPGQTFQVGEAGREMFVGASGNVDMLGATGKETRRFNEPGMVVPNPVTEAIMQGAVAAPEPALAMSGGPSTPPVDYAALAALMPPIHVDASGMDRVEAEVMIANAIRRSRQDAETKYGRP